jgi:hypothetical protein
MEENAKKNKKKKTKGKGKKVAKGNKASKADKRKKKTPESVRGTFQAPIYIVIMRWC